MEEENNEVKTKKESYITGIIGALIGGTIATIPWVLMYVYGNMMLSILAALIAAGEFYGYKIAKRKINKKLPAILMVLAIIIVTIATLVVIPALLIQKQNIPVTVDTIKLLYSDSEFVTAFMRDFIISIIFTILGASIITANIKKQLQENDGKDIKIDLNNNKQLEEAKNNAIEMIKPIFIKYDATEESKAMMKEEVFAEIEDKSAKQSFNYLKQLKVIKKYKGKYYYSEENEKKQLKPKKISTMGIVGIIILVCAIIAMFLSLVGNFGTDKQFKDENVSFEISDKWNEATADYDTEWNFYKYINSIPSAEKSQNTRVNRIILHIQQL